MTKWDLALGMDRDNKEHQQLSMEMLEVWASTMVSLLQQYIVLLVDICVPQLKEDSVATEESPPNHRSFDVITRISPVVQAQCDTANAANAAVVPPAFPTINISFPPEIMAEFRAPPLLAAPALPSYASHMLLLPPCAPGTNMPIAQFCVEYELDDGICA